MTSRKSFTNARSWLADVREHADPHLTCILVGNKIDLCDEEAEGQLSRRREVSTDEADEWARKEGLLFVETSAKSGNNVDLAFEKASREILHKIKRGVFDDDRFPGVKLSNPTNGSIALNQASNKLGCCS